jgi:hypothetical protein
VLEVLKRYHRKDSLEWQRRSLNTPGTKADSQQVNLDAVNSFYANAWKQGGQG